MTDLTESEMLAIESMHDHEPLRAGLAKQALAMIRRYQKVIGHVCGVCRFPNHCSSVCPVHPVRSQD